MGFLKEKLLRWYPLLDADEKSALFFGYECKTGISHVLVSLGYTYSSWVLLFDILRYSNCGLLLFLDTIILGYSYSWVLLFLETLIFGYSYPWVLLFLGTLIFENSYFWKLLFLDTLILRYSYYYGYSYPSVVALFDVLRYSDLGYSMFLIILILGCSFDNSVG